MAAEPVQHLKRVIMADRYRNITNNAEDYLTLAHIYLSQKKFDQAAKVIDEASSQGADPVDVYLEKPMPLSFKRILKLRIQFSKRQSNYVRTKVICAVKAVIFFS